MRRISTGKKRQIQKKLFQISIDPDAHPEVHYKIGKELGGLWNQFFNKSCELGLLIIYTFSIPEKI